MRYGGSRSQVATAMGEPNAAVTRDTEGFTPPQKPKASAHPFLTCFFFFPDLRGRRVLAQKHGKSRVRPPSARSPPAAVRQ